MNISSDASGEEIAKKKAHDRKVLHIILIIGVLIILVVPVNIAAILFYRA